MTELLHIKASPRADLSHSGKAAAGFIAALEKHRPGLRVREIDVWKADLPDFDGPLLAAKYARLTGRPFTPQEAESWAAIEELVGVRTAVQDPMLPFLQAQQPGAAHGKFLAEYVQNLATRLL